MQQNWCEFRICLPAAGVDLLAEELSELGCAGVNVEERQLDTFIPPDPDEPLTGSVCIRAYFPQDPAGTDPLRQQIFERLQWLAPLVPGLEPVLPEVVAVRNEDWAEGWKQHFRPVRIGRRLIVRPSWEEVRVTPPEVLVTLDPGMAFGTGTHGTTRLCLEALAARFDGPQPPRRVLDVGTGSGILAVAAAALGAERVLACDIEPEACRTARENARRNGVDGVVEVTDAALETLEMDFDLVLANILAEENIRLADALTSRLAAGGELVLSGILVEKEALVAEAFSRFDLQGPVITHREEWSCLVYRRSA